MSLFQTNSPQWQIYQRLRQEIQSQNPNLNTIIFLTGMVHGYGEYGFMVPEIEDCFIFIEKHTGRDMLCL